MIGELAQLLLVLALLAAAVQAWAKAWASKNMQGYLGAYAPSFTPPAGQSRSEWQAERRARIVPRSRIGPQTLLSNSKFLLRTALGMRIHHRRHRGIRRLR